MDCHQKFVLSWNGRENTILIKKFPEFIQKIQNTVLFIKSDIVPFQSILPIDCNALMPALDPALETFLELYLVGIVIRALIFPLPPFGC